MMLPAAIFMLLSFFPMFLLITRYPGMPTLLVGLIWDILLQVAYVSAAPAVMAAIFPARTRVTGLSLTITWASLSLAALPRQSSPG